MMVFSAEAAKGLHERSVSPGWSNNVALRDDSRMSNSPPKTAYRQLSAATSYAVNTSSGLEQIFRPGSLN